MTLGVNGPRNTIATEESPRPTFAATFRARFRKYPCTVGWHQFVLTYDGVYYRKICEHCGRGAD